MGEITAVAFDKTGTLTEGVFKVMGLRPAEGAGEEELREVARVAEALSGHPLARSIREAFGTVPPHGIKASENTGKGVCALRDGETFYAGRVSWLRENGVEGVSEAPDDSPATRVYVGRGTRFLGTLTVSDVIRPDAARAVRALHDRGIRSYLLTGDRRDTAEHVAAELGMDNFRAELLPEMKVAALRELAGEGLSAFVGDGVNDAPLLASAHVGIAMGALGSDVALSVYREKLGDRGSTLYDLLGEISQRIEIEDLRKANNLGGAFCLGYDSQRYEIIEERRRKKAEREANKEEK